MMDLNEINMLDFFALRKNGVSPDLMADTKGLSGPNALRLLANLLEQGAVELRNGRYFAVLDKRPSLHSSDEAAA